MSIRYLLQRDSHYFFRIHVPLDLRPWFDGRQELKKSLKTTRYDAAVSGLRCCLYRTERLFTLMRSGLMTDAEIKKLVADYLEETLKRNEDARAEIGKSAGLSFPDDTGIHEILFLEYREDLAAGRHAKLGNVADYVLDAAGITIPKGSPEYLKLCRELLKGLVEVVLPTELERMKGNYENEYDRPGGYLSLLRGSTLPSSPTAGQREATSPGEPLSKLVREYIEDRVKGKRWRGDRTRLEAEGIFKLFLRIVGSPVSGGDRDIRTLERKDFAHFRDVLLLWPSNLNKRREFRGKKGEPLSVEQILGMGVKERLLSKTSINKHLMYVSAFIGWCVSSGHLDSDYSKGLTVRKQRVKESAEREAYDAEDIKRLFHSPIYTTNLPEKQPERYWLPLILLMSGMRLNEAAGLRVQDVREVEGVLCFDVNEVGERELKTANSQRLIPVHPLLSEVGFLEYVEGLRRAGAVRLFPNLQQKGGSFGVAFSRWWGRYGREWITKNPKKSLHSARGSFVTSLLNARVEEAVVKALVGHSAGGETAGRYMKGYEPRILLSAISRLSYGREVEEELRKLPRLG